MLRRAALLVLLAGCAVQPDYQRPALDLPPAWQEAAPRPASNEPWWRVYGDPALERLIDEGLANNRDLEIAAERVEEARAQWNIAQSALMPSVDAQLQADR
ncbi:MAG: TolC family protein, partial [Burkholderiales bacterium]